MKPADLIKQQQVVSITYEEIGLFPRSFNRVFDRFFKQVFSDVENLVIQEYRFYKFLFLTTLKCLFLLIFIPFLVNFIAKTYLVKPLAEYFWNTKQTEIFLNSYQQKLAFSELQDFEEKIYFESLIFSNNRQGQFNDQKKVEPFKNYFSTDINNEEKNLKETKIIIPKKKVSEYSKFLDKNQNLVQSEQLDFTDNNKKKKDSLNFENLEESKVIFPSSRFPFFPLNKEKEDTAKIEKNKKEFSSLESVNSIQKRLQEKVMELALRSNDHSIEAITNFFADSMSLITLCFLFFKLEIQLNITKSFLLEVFFGLDDSKKSLFILFVTDLLVGYHSPNIWEFFFQFLFYHYGLPESQTSIFLLVATLPVLLDVLFKYIIFRHLNRASPATVATYHAMIE
uniref:Potassium/proton antiporter CemA n=1 Tax=Jenufa perforata TaxID=993091 RepID=A0A0S2LN74_9CHLO|nr:chloroplast enveloppe membrane protein [Jenufa perforata]ALO62850.1 chloroplast enveloppe membrane protein [Jenufa perforata]